jgi:type I restriction enzyme, S subunit
MDCIDDSFGIITKKHIKKVSEVQKGYTNFQDDDVLFAKITPCMENGKCSIAKNLKNNIGFGSTEFHVLRTSHLVIPEWIFYYLRQEKIRQKAERNMTGSAGQKRVPTRFLADLRIPLPPLEEQKRIAQIVGKCDLLRRTRRYTQQLSDTYLQSVFLEMFGDPLSNPYGWSQLTVEDISTKITDGEHATPERTTEGIKLLSARNIQNGYIDFNTGLDYIPDYEYQRIRKRCNPETGDILMSCSGSIGRVTTVELNEPFSMVRSVALIKPLRKKIKSKYLEHWLRSNFSQQLINKTAHQSSQANIFTGQIKELPVLLPPMQLQEKFAQIVQRFERLRAQQRESDRQAEHLFQSILHRAFQGEL